MHKVAYFRLNAAWQEAGRLKALGVRPLPAYPVARVRMSAGPLFALAAMVVLATAAVLFGFRERLFHFNTYSTAVGGLEAIPMADGSRVTLNTDSAMRIFLREDERHIELDKGEAFFEVTRDLRRPFVVKAGNLRVIAVGTRFSVRRDAADVRVIVTEGTVRVEPEGAAVLLPAGSIARAGAGNVLVERRPVPEVEQALTWRGGILTFRDTSLADAVAEFNRYNVRQIVIRDPAVAALRVGGIFGATQPGPFVHLLESGFPVRVSEAGGEIILSAR